MTGDTPSPEQESSATTRRAPAARRSPTRYGASRADYESTLLEWGEPAYRAEQVWSGLYRTRLPLEACTSLPEAVRERLAGAFPAALEEVELRTDGRTTKWLCSTHDGAQVETVLMCSQRRATVCVSSQAGCAMGCPFCATGQAGFQRHLSRGEIVEQVARAMHAAPRRVRNVVFMGMGEPLANFDATAAAVRRLRRDFGLSARGITISTVGIVPGMRRLVEQRVPVTLAVSLHAPDDELRSRLVPLNDRHPIAEVLDAAADYANVTGRRVSFEYACIAGVNDDPAQADALALRLRDYTGAGGAHVNLIPLNPTPEFAGHASDDAAVAAFAGRLRRRGIATTVRQNRGVDLDAACGQLRSRASVSPGARATGHNGPSPAEERPCPSNVDS